MKNIIPFLIVALVIISCSSSKTSIPKNNNISATTKNDTVRIANDELQYEVIIIDPGFNSWLATRAQPRNFYTQNYMETRNRIWVANWNINVNSGRNRNLFEMTINYDNHIDYGYEVNYLLFNYLTYFQITNNIQLGGFPARI